MNYVIDKIGSDHLFKGVFRTQTVKMERLSVPLEGLVDLGGLIHLVRGVSTSPLCVMVYRTVLVALMK